MLQANLLFKVNGQTLCQDYIHLKISGIFCLQSRTSPNSKSITWRPTLIESQMWGLVKGALRHQLQQLHTSWAKSWLAIWSPPPPHALPTTFKPHLNIKSSRLHIKTLWIQKATSTFTCLFLPKLTSTFAANRFSIRILDFNNVVAVWGRTPF